jgi:hypothetical protein
MLRLFQQLPTAAPPELITEATFKPRDLKDHLAAGREFRQIVKNALGSDRGQGSRSRPLVIEERKDRGKTRYQKILEECFQKKEKPEGNRAKVNH